LPAPAPLHLHLNAQSLPYALRTPPFPPSLFAFKTPPRKMVSGMLMVTLTTFTLLNNWLTMDLFREFAMKIYFARQPTADKHTVMSMMGFFGSMNGLAGIILVGSHLIPACQDSTGDGVNLIKGPADKQTLTLISGMWVAWLVSMALMIFQGKADQLGMKKEPLYGWMVLQVAAAILSIIAATDDASLSNTATVDADGNVDKNNTLHLVIVIVFFALSVVKIAITPVSDGDAKAPTGDANA